MNCPVYRKYNQCYLDSAQLVYMKNFTYNECLATGIYYGQGSLVSRIFNNIFVGINEVKITSVIL